MGNIGFIRRKVKKKEATPQEQIIEDKCGCPYIDPSDVGYNFVQYIEEENKGVVDYHSDKNKSGFTYGVAQFVGKWYHASIVTDIPKKLRKLEPTKEGRVWQDSIWHVTDWILYSDPYDHSKHWFRYWRRIEKLAKQEVETEQAQEEEIRHPHAVTS